MLTKITKKNKYNFKEPHPQPGVGSAPLNLIIFAPSSLKFQNK